MTRSHHNNHDAEVIESKSNDTSKGSHPERAVVGGAEHFGLVRGGDDGQGVHRPHVAGQGAHLLLGFNVPHL